MVSKTHKKTNISAVKIHISAQGKVEEFRTGRCYFHDHKCIDYRTATAGDGPQDIRNILRKTATQILRMVEVTGIHITVMACTFLCKLIGTLLLLY